MSIWTTGWEKGTTRGWARETLRAPILTGAHLRVPQCIHSMRRHISTFPLYIITITGHWPSNKASRLALSHDFKWTLGSQRCYSPCLKAVLTRSPSSRSFSVTMLLILPGIFWRKKGQPNYPLSDSSCQFPNSKLCQYPILEHSVKDQAEFDFKKVCLHNVP